MGTREFSSGSGRVLRHRRSPVTPERVEKELVHA
jgi:hypothetical protein